MPEAIRIHRIAVQRMPRGAKAPVKPVGTYLSGNGIETSAVGDEISQQMRPRVDQAIAAQPDAWAKYCAGEEKAAGALVGSIMKASKGKANPAQVNEVLRRKLGG